jgi:diphthamide synthase (EF-2-diphthine--ammonia ligase)
MQPNRIGHAFAKPPVTFSEIRTVAKHCEIHVGELDWQSNPESVTALAKLTGWDVAVVKGAEHMLPKEYVGAVLEGWLGE